jgi:hypothetical protein
MSAIFVVLAFVVIWVLKTIFSQKKGGSVNMSHYRSNAPYPRAYGSKGLEHKLPTPQAAKEQANQVPQCKFLLTAKQHLQRDYYLIIDRSGSMSWGGRWAEAEKAVKSLAPYICKFDPDGITLYFFDHEVNQFDNIQTQSQVEELFRTYKPRGSTNLALALHTAFDHHFKGQRGASTMLVVTDGSPDSQEEVKRIVRRATHSMLADEELSVSFIQIGNDVGATKFLKLLDDDLDEAKFDIVDTISAEAAGKISFAELVARSIYD